MVFQPQDSTVLIQPTGFALLDGRYWTSESKQMRLENWTKTFMAGGWITFVDLLILRLFYSIVNWKENTISSTAAGASVLSKYSIYADFGAPNICLN
jgi:hypothetical protein